MRILVVGATGTIGRPVVEALSARHEVVEVSRRSTPFTVDASTSPLASFTVTRSWAEASALVGASGLSERTSRVS